MSDETPLYEHLDKNFPKLVSGAAKLETLFEDCRWAEGPVRAAA